MKKTWPIEIDCPNCAAKLERALAQLPGVDRVSVNYVQKRITLEAADDKFADVTRAVLAKTAEIEPDTVIHMDSARPAAAHHHEHDDHDHCSCGHDHDHHHEHDGHDHDHCSCGHDHDHHHEHDGHDHHDHGHDHAQHHAHGNTMGAGKTLLVRVGVTAALCALGFLARAEWLAAVCFVLAYLCAGYDVVWTALRNIRRGEVFDENFLMSIASLGALAMGEYAEGVMVMLLYQIGEYLQDKAVDKSRESITALMDVRPDHADVLRGGEAVRVHPEAVGVGESILVRPGEKIPLDGVIREGNSTLDTAALTGESLPRDVSAGDAVLSGCVNLTGVLTVEVTAAYGQSTVAKILALVAESGEAKAKTERFITRFSRVYTPLVCLAALLLAVVPSLVTGDWAKWVYTALTFLVISCPCALVISVPLTFFSGIGGASKRGVLVKGANHIETLAVLDTVALDKTGTLTRGVFTVAQVVPQGVTEAELLDVAAHAEGYSAHPIARCLREGRDLSLERVHDVEDLPGRGLRAQVDGRSILCGNARLMAENGVSCGSPDVPGAIVHVAADGAYRGYIVISDEVKAGSAQAMAELRALDVNRLVMLTGDHAAAAAQSAKALGLTDYRASLLPADKVEALAGLLGEGHHVAFVGDGVNDAPVLRRADVGVAMGALGSEAAIEAADVVLMDDDPRKIALAVRIARKTMQIARQNIAFALAVKLAVMILGVAGFANMWLAVFADVGVAMLCILNAVRTMKVK